MWAKDEISEMGYANKHFKWPNTYLCMIWGVRIVVDLELQNQTDKLCCLKEKSQRATNGD